LKDTDEHKLIIDLSLKGKDKTKEIIKKYNEYASHGVYYVKADGTMDTKALLDEIGAEFMEKILSDPQVAEQIWDTNPTLAERIMRFFEDMIARLKGQKMSDVNRKALEAYQRGLHNMKHQQQGQGEIRYMIGHTTDGKPVVKIETDIFANMQPDEKKHEVMAEYIRKHIGEVYTIIESGQKVYIGEDLPGEFTHSKSTQRMKNKKQWDKLDAKNQSFQNVGELIEIATNRQWKKNEKEKHAVDARYGWYHYDTRFALPNGEVYTAELLIRNDANGKKYLYDLIKIKEDDSVLASTQNGSAIRAENSALSDSNHLLSGNSVPQNQQESNTKKRFSLDTSGRKLSEQQQEYFANSKARDENGNLLVMYHGSPNAGFTEFRSGTYFTPMKWYADGYQKQGASMLSHKKTADNPDTYEVYLNIEKPFDTRNPKERRIFEQEYYRQWGTGAPLADSGLPDWTDGMDLQEFIEEKGYDYDGLILDEGAVGGYGEEVKSRGLSYVVFSPEQVKNVDNQTPTNSADIRYALPKMPNQKYLAESDKNLQAFMYDSKVVNDDGSPKVVYSGHGNTNLFGSAFDKKKATAGGFYFTANPDIASNYAKNKMGVKEYYEDGSEYRIKDEKGKYKLQLRDVRLTDEQAEKFDEWFEESLGWTFDRFVKERGGYDYRYRRLSKRNLADLYWLMSENGYTLPNTVYTSEGAISGKSDFEELMDAMGIEWDSYSTNHGGVFPVYLSIRNPIDTSKPFPSDVMKRLERIASRERRLSWDELDEAHWTADYPVYKWIEDIKEMEEIREETCWGTQVATNAR
jgi:hypothetical protein